MAVVDIPALGAAAALADAHLFPVTQGSAVAKKLTASQLATYVVASDSDLAAIAALTTTAFGRSLLELANGAALGTAVDVPSLPSAGALASSDFLAITQGSATLRRTTLGTLASLVIATDSDLAAIAALTTTAFGRSLLELANATALRTLADAEQLGIAGINSQTASYTLTLSDIGKIVEVQVVTANTVTVPPNSSVAFATGARIDIAQIGAGQTTITAGAGVTINQRESKFKLAGQWAMASLYKRAIADAWVLVGDLAA